jgi:hypothetical protein
MRAISSERTCMNKLQRLTMAAAFAACFAAGAANADSTDSPGDTGRGASAGNEKQGAMQGGEAKKDAAPKTDHEAALQDCRAMDASRMDECVKKADRDYAQAGQDRAPRQDQDRSAQAAPDLSQPGMSNMREAKGGY